MIKPFVILPILAVSSVCGITSNAVAETDAASPKRKPNIILLLADDVSARELSTYGGTIPMPALDKLADHGVKFQNAWSAPLCGPSRAILLTGKLPHNQGYWENPVRPNIPYFRDKRHLPLLRMARDAGYATGWFGKLDIGNPEDFRDIGVDTYLTYRFWQGYDGPDQGRGGPSRAGMYGVSWYWHPGLMVDGKGMPTTPDDFGPDLEAEALIRFAEANKDRPFLAYWPTNLPHMAFDPASKTWYYTDVPERDAGGQKTGRKIPGSLDSTMRYLDALLARVGAQLEHLGIADNTIIFFMGDNGTAVIDKGHYDRDVALRVPFVVSGGPVKPMGEVTTPIDFTDIWPTVADLIGYTGTRNTDGYSFAPLLLGKPFKPRGFARMAMNNARWVRTEDWLLDGYGRLYKVTGARTRKDYRDMTGSDDPEAVAAYSKLRALAEKHLLLPNYNDPLTRDAWQWFHKHGGMPVKVIKAEAP